ncbi:hypothetical protein L226DRAFT_614020 [Lentinus tigrinus ALCF2SS1-7]|uniref:ABM domain-containing protein n=1 Tax=Lentinus tigrinus ALCF2SS1-6 TaxID=1328759 RepID=A0A5C2S7R8_9APHY|nr:hypothetical protein L227DRAFT_576397 [Lentinus tigrinus ALCF2SS1-6]RPD73504.1 hypothetical protein L226DRAFT_614020 [Lentinus tigrinus ALCF2SS1-7]
MGNPTVELVYAPATELVRNDPHNKDVVATPFSVLKAQDGLIKIYYGVQHEDKATAYHVMVWESYEHHEKLMNDTATYPKLTGSVESVFDKSKGSVTMQHINTTDEPYKAFEAPVVEIATFTLHEGQSKSELEGLMKNLADGMNAKTEADGVLHASWGPIRENDNAFILFIGWTTVDAHWAFVKSDPGAIDTIAKCKAISDIALVHVPLALY